MGINFMDLEIHDFFLCHPFWSWPKISSFHNVYFMSETILVEWLSPHSLYTLLTANKGNKRFDHLKNLLNWFSLKAVQFLNLESLTWIECWNICSILFDERKGTWNIVFGKFVKSYWFFFFKQNNYTVTSVFELIGKTGTCVFSKFLHSLETPWRLGLV